ncbi:VWA domain-containing protein [Candidatus Saccharibacteria bacterium]|nr:VWA domain-containing protein [Candidatus Saccharibacteria bacterium]
MPAANPALGNSCGLDIALVLDNSTSIDSTELASMKSAMTSFTSAFSGTPTQFSVTKFATTGSVVQSFTSNFTNVNNAINGIPVSGGSTNWEDGLLKAQSTFDPRINPNLVVFASDGNPNRIGNGTTADETTSVNAAIAVANDIKTNTGARIIALGIGTDVNTTNLEKVSSADAVITSGFDTLATTLAGFASQLCGGTITTTKIIDGDGNPDTTNDQTLASGWTFTVDGNDYVTDAQGQTEAVDVDPGNYSVDETVKSGYEVVSASCKINGQSVGSWDDNSVTNIDVSATDIVSCVFINSLKPGEITVNKVIDNSSGGTKTYTDFSFTLNNQSYDFDADGSVTVSVPDGTYTVVENEANQNGYKTSYDNCTNIQVTRGDKVTCTITNDDIAPKVTVTKVVDNGNTGGTLEVKDFTLYVDTTVVVSGEENQFNVGTVTVSEDGVSGYIGEVTGDCNSDGTVSLELGGVYNCTITNTAQQAYIIIDKTVKNDNGGTAKPDDFNLTVDGNAVEDEVAYAVNPGTHTAGETNLPGYTAGTWGGDCDENGDVTVALGETKTCTITNTAKQAYITVVKEVTNDNSGTAEPDDFLLTLDGNSLKSGEQVAVNPGTYQAAETLFDGYTFTGFSGDCDSEGYVTVSLGVSKTCILTNDDIAHPSIKVVKSGPSSASAGSKVTYNFTVTNSGDVALSGITVVDSITGDATYVSGDIDDDNNLDADETWIYTAEYTIPANQVANVVNTVEVCGYESYAQNLSLVFQLDRLVSNTVFDERTPVCAEDSHTLSIPKVLGESTTKTSTQAVLGTSTLVNTGREIVSNIVFGITVLMSVLFLARVKSEK